MSLSDRRGFLWLAAGACLSASGCGFRPLRAKGAPGEALSGQVSLSGFDGRFGYYLRQSLNDTLGDPVPAPRYSLKVTAVTSKEDIAISQTNEVTRLTFRARADFVLTDSKTGETVIEDWVENLSAYNATSSVYATRINERDIEKRLAEDLGGRIYRRLAAHEARRTAG